MYIITFYSFKGGVGRTFALVNVGAELARRGRRVLLVDFDLEAPGLETFERLQPPQPHAGVVEYVAEYLRTKQTPDVGRFVYSAGTIDKGNGKLLVMPAGRRDLKYQEGLVNIDWKRLYHSCKGFEFFEDTKKQWEEAFEPDYVLIDSRTGHTDVEGICTRQLPNAVVVLFFPNEQNLAGLRDVCRRIRAEKNRALKKAIRLHFVMSNVPDLDDEDEILQRRMEAFHKELGIGKLDAIIHRYESAMLFNQAIFVLDRPRSRLAREYQQLIEELITANPADREGALHFLHQYAQSFFPSVARDVSNEVNRKLGILDAEPLPSPSDAANPGAIQEALRKLALRTLLGGEGDALDKILRRGNFLDDAEVLHQVAQCRTLEGDFEQALGLLNRVLVLQPDLAQVRFERAMCKSRLGDSAGAEADLLDYLRSPNLESHDTLRALRKLHDIAPGRMVEAVDLPAVQMLDFAAMSDVCELLRHTASGLDRAIEILRNLLTHQIEGTGPFKVELHLRERLIDPSKVELHLRERLIDSLIATRRWPEAIALVEAQPPDALSDLDLFSLAMAKWGETGDLPEHLCRRALEVDEAESQTLACDYPDVKCWLLWRTGNVSEALSMVDRASERVKEGYFLPFSYWRYRHVSIDEYLDDCRQLRRMIQGEPIRPAFLGEPIAPDASDGSPKR